MATPFDVGAAVAEALHYGRGGVGGGRALNPGCEARRVEDVEQALVHSLGTRVVCARFDHVAQVGGRRFDRGALPVHGVCNCTLKWSETAGYKTGRRFWL